MSNHRGSNFDDFLEEEGVLEEVTARALKRTLALQMEDIMRDEKMTKKSLAEKLHTSRSQLDRLLDPDNSKTTLDSLQQIASALGKNLSIRFA
ncbi:MAG: Fis family transcriptional regulator [Gammaproteobacteria bacterium]|nr:MAG: Fis family transcriptional regulator [Gammaproteobacteria bacterium]